MGAFNNDYAPVFWSKIVVICEQICNFLLSSTSLVTILKVIEKVGGHLAESGVAFHWSTDLLQLRAVTGINDGTNLHGFAFLAHRQPNNTPIFKRMCILIHLAHFTLDKKIVILSKFPHSVYYSGISPAAEYTWFYVNNMVAGKGCPFNVLSSSQVK